MSNLTPIGIIAAKDMRDALQDRFILLPLLALLEGL